MSKWLLNELGRGGDRGAGARENRGRERAGSGRTGGAKRENRGREAGEHGAGSGIYMRAGSGSRSKEGYTKFVVYYWVLFSQKHLPFEISI